ncbi:SUMF1/EgtB/PvdO family nonheme iron enzyme [Chondrinema litorale]|uniref:SUMF1/EgtB/PvdO family nonheme iron enzyme n=1 Tax=Chondrinema litorale TaxID=2994555 RepID=UPI002543B136|nr:SUMF1/EgtB/PvdO family nonheme iron enzyme [Chondrinema litorale]UZR96567.1 SUMF1/EgtB/PvdO family nonheme iron enzyme [Chondrinema litorale]
MTETNSHKAKVFISYAWSGESERIASEVEKALSEKGLEIVRDKSGGLDYKGLIKEFMQEIGKGNFVIVIISDKYLRSENCMFELIEIAKNGNFAQRIFPIILEDAKIYKPIEQVKYLKYWEEQITELNVALNELLDIGDTAEIQDELSFYKQIRKEISGLVGQLKNMNTLTPEMHQKSNFQQIYDQIEDEVSVKEKFDIKNELLKGFIEPKISKSKYEYDLFLCYSIKDLNFINDIIFELRAYNIRVFSSNDNLSTNAGKSYFENINYALEASQHFLLVCTPNSMKSGWVKQEYTSFFSNQFIKSKEKRRFLILKGPYFDVSLVPQLLLNIHFSNNISDVIMSLIVKQNVIKKTQLPNKNHQNLKKLTKIPEWLEMVYVEGGSYQMGYDSDVNGQNNEMKSSEPMHQVSVESFYISKYKYLITQEQWVNIMKDNPSKFKTNIKCPVDSVNWFDVQEFIKRLNYRTKQKFRLPYEVEWEFAASGGKLSKGYKYSGSDEIDEVAWYKGNSNNKTHPVGLKKANELGIFDMSGNVWEWCEDDWHSNYIGAPISNIKWVDLDYNNSRVQRGGSWNRDENKCQIISRSGDKAGFWNLSINGFRLVTSAT